MARLSGKVAIITGAGSGIGAATAKLLASQGATIVAVGRHLENIQSVANDITAAGGEALAIAADVSDEAQIQSMVKRAITAYGHIDILHNNAALTDAAVISADGRSPTRLFAGRARVCRQRSGSVHACMHIGPNVTNATLYALFVLFVRRTTYAGRFCPRMAKRPSAKAG